MKRFLSIPLLLLFLYGCQSQNSANDYAKSLNDSTSASGLTGDSVKLVKTAGIRFKVTNVEQSLKDISALAQQRGGRIYEQNFEAVEGDKKELHVSKDSLLAISTFSPQANLTVRIPSQALEEFLFAVAGIGYYTGNSNLKIDDKSLAYLQNALKQKARTDVLASPPPKAIVPGNRQAIAVKDEAIAQLIANKTIDADAAYSTVNLSLFQNALVRKETIANYVLRAYELPFGQRMQNALANGWDAFLNFVLLLSNLWVFVLIGLLGLLFYKYFLLKRKPVQQTNL
jgi:hypothetical protein